MDKERVMPIKPSEVSKKKAESLPGEVLEAFNEMIAKYWNGTSSKFKQKEAIELILSKMNVSKETADKFNAKDLFKNKMLDVEDVYRDHGWNVSYDGPGYCETYDATFEFRK